MREGALSEGGEEDEGERVGRCHENELKRRERGGKAKGEETIKRDGREEEENDEGVVDEREDSDEEEEKKGEG